MARRKKKGLEPKQARFVQEYLVDLNATKAAERAGYSPKTAASQGARLLINVKVLAAIETAKQRRLARVELTQDRVLEELEVVGFSDIRDYAIDDQGTVAPARGAPDRVMRAISRIRKTVMQAPDGSTRRQVDVWLWEKGPILKALGQHVGVPRDTKTFSFPIDYEKLTAEELDRIAAGEPPLVVLASTRAGRDR